MTNLVYAEFVFVQTLVLYNTRSTIFISDPPYTKPPFVEFKKPTLLSILFIL